MFSQRESLIGLYKEVSLSTMLTHSQKRVTVPMNTTTSTGERFFCSAPNGVFNLCSSFTDVKEFERLHQVIQSSKLSNSHCERDLPQYAHRTDPLFNVFESKQALRWTLVVRTIDVRGWELRLRNPSGTAVKAKYLSHIDSFHTVCKDGEPDIVKAMVERTQVDLGRGVSMTIHHYTGQGSPPCCVVPVRTGG